MIGIVRNHFCRPAFTNIPEQPVRIRGLERLSVVKKADQFKFILHVQRFQKIKIRCRHFNFANIGIVAPAVTFFIRCKTFVPEVQVADEKNFAEFGNVHIEYGTIPGQDPFSYSSSLFEREHKAGKPLYTMTVVDCSRLIDRVFQFCMIIQNNMQILIYIVGIGNIH